MPPTEGYLLDTPVSSAAWDAVDRSHDAVRRRLAALDGLLYVSSISAGEVEYGLGVSPAVDPQRHRDVRLAMSAYDVLDVNKHTGEAYGRIRANLFERYAPRNQRGRLTRKYVEDLTDPTTSKELGIQENDLWIVSVAVQYNLVLVTFDKAGGMRRIVEAADYLERTEFWT